MSYYDLFIAERLDTKRWQESVNEICGWSEERTGRRCGGGAARTATGYKVSNGLTTPSGPLFSTWV
tara:strand:- start:1347 stop:1544 length:198 start_codon:yes stop_codon:yes gene_type:complete